MHTDIKRFGLEGTINDRYFIRFREQREAEIRRDMREQGYVPLVGFGPFWTTVYNMPKDNYDFKLSMHGIYVGKERACQIDGITMEGITLTSTQQDKSKQSSTESE